jgi:hypothetical protein
MVRVTRTPEERQTRTESGDAAAIERTVVSRAVRGGGSGRGSGGRRGWARGGLSSWFVTYDKDDGGGE